MKKTKTHKVERGVFEEFQNLKKKLGIRFPKRFGKIFGFAHEDDVAALYEENANLPLDKSRVDWYTRILLNNNRSAKKLKLNSKQGELLARYGLIFDVLELEPEFTI